MNKSDVPESLVDRDAFYSRSAYPSALCISLTERCNIRCAHCIFACTGNEARRADFGFIDRMIREAAEVEELKVVGFTGGEPFLEFAQLARLLDRCAALGLKATVTTNAYWARTGQAAKEKLSRLPGLSRLGISCDRFHQEFVSIDKVRHAIRACAELDIECAVRVSYLNDPHSEIQCVQRQLEDVAGLFRLEHQPVQPLGRAKSELEPQTLFSCDIRTGCCLSVESPYVDIDGDVYACCGPASCFGQRQLLYLGNAKTRGVAEILNEAKLNPIISALKSGGPSLLLDIAEQEAARVGQQLSSNPVGVMCSQCEVAIANDGHASFLRKAIGRPKVRRMIAMRQMAVFGDVTAFAALSD